jgi:hypothetical protein
MHFFWRVRRTSKSGYQFRHVRLCVCNNSVLTRRIFMKFNIEYFSKSQENPSFIKIWSV